MLVLLGLCNQLDGRFGGATSRRVLVDNVGFVRSKLLGTVSVFSMIMLSASQSRAIILPVRVSCLGTKQSLVRFVHLEPVSHVLRRQLTLRLEMLRVSVFMNELSALVSLLRPSLTVCPPPLCRSLIAYQRIILLKLFDLVDPN